MELAAANTFTGDVTVNAGILRLTHASALGTTAGGTTVNRGAQSSLVGLLNVGAEALTFANTGSDTPGVLSASGGNSSWAGPIHLAADASLNVATGLDLSGAISGAGGFTKLGTGALGLSGSDRNTYAGTTRVHAGTVNPNKSVNDAAIPGEWRLIVKDEDHDMVDGVLHGWTLHLYPAVCADGGGPCLPCPEQLIQGMLTAQDPETLTELRHLNGASACDRTPAKPCPGWLLTGAPERPPCYRIYPFQNGAADA